MMRDAVLSTLVVAAGIVACGDATEEEDMSEAATGLSDPLRIVASDDAFVDATRPRMNFGAARSLASDTSPEQVSYVKFKVDGVTGPIESAKLVLSVLHGTGDGPAVYATSTSWNEGSITYEGRPARTGALIADLGALASGTTVTVDVSSVVKGNGTYSFGLYATSSAWVTFGAKERRGSGPQLRITTSSPSPSPSPSPSASPSASPTTTAPSPPPTSTSPAPTAPPPPTTSRHLYVSPTGNDTSPGTQSAPFKTINKGVKEATPDTTIHVAPGTYAETIKSTIDGTASGRIRYVSDVKWGAKIVPPPSSTSSSAWDNRGAYVDIDGFEVDGKNHQGGTVWSMGIYSAGSSSAIMNTKVHDIAHDPGVSSCTSGGGAAIEGDSWYGGTDIDVIGNFVYDVGYSGCSFVQGIYQTAPGRVVNNVVSQAGEACIHLWHDANHIDIVNNTVVACRVGILVGGGDFVHTSGPADYVTVANNIVYDSTMAIDEQGKTGVHNVYTNNLLFENGTNWGLQNGLVGTNTVAADPRFVAYARSGGDLHLQAASPAIDEGTTTNAPAYDVEGFARSQGGLPDIGAYEWHP